MLNGGACHAQRTTAEQAYPAKPIRFIVPQATGGSNDTFARLMGHHLSERLGKQMVIHACVDPEFKKRLLADGRAACAEMGTLLEAERLIAVENTPEVHNIIVCTLCSCYPRALLGMPLADIRLLAGFHQQPAAEPCDRVNALIDEQIQRVHSQIETLQRLEQQLLQLRARCDSPHTLADCGILKTLDDAASGEACACHSD